MCKPFRWTWQTSKSARQTSDDSVGVPVNRCRWSLAQGFGSVVVHPDLVAYGVVEVFGVPNVGSTDDHLVLDHGLGTTKSGCCASHALMVSFLSAANISSDCGVSASSEEPRNVKTCPALVRTLVTLPAAKFLNIAR